MCRLPCKNIQLIHFIGKKSWISAVQECQSFGPEWTLPLKEDMDLASLAVKIKDWRSVWTGIKRVKFDGFYWEDGSKLLKQEINGNNWTIRQIMQIIIIYVSIESVLFKNNIYLHV